MFGHGRPVIGWSFWFGDAARREGRWTRRTTVAVWLCALLLTASSWGGDELDFRVRMSWGGGARRQWRGAISISAGKLSEPRCLGIEADTPPELLLSNNRLWFAQRAPVSFDGLDVRILGAADAIVTVELVPFDDKAVAKKIELRLADFLPAVQFVHESTLDDRQNRLQIQRAPGDRLRVRIERDSLVFAPGEELVLEAQPHGLGVPDGTALKCTIQLQVSGDDVPIWKEQRDVLVDGQGNSNLLTPIRKQLPAEEGVYEVLIMLQQRRLAEAIGRIGDVLVPNKPIAQRKVQLVVIDTKPFPAETADWTLLEEIDSANPHWWEKWVLPPLKKLPGISVESPLGDQPLRMRELEGVQLKEIAPSGWHAAPVPIGNIGEPHLLEIEYPSKVRQTLGISIIEPDAAGHVGTQGIDSGIDVEMGASPGAAMERHRVVFWPRTKTPWLLLTNRRDSAPALVGAIRVLTGPEGLPSRPVGPAADGYRGTAAYFDKPLFPRNFSAPESLDEPSGRSLSDWNTFYLGAIRFAEYLKYAGYSAAFVPVLIDGMTLYPTRVLDTIPKYDSGVFFVSGQDPMPKDVLELLLRVFDREGLRLVPVVQFGIPIPELEAKIQQENVEQGGLLLVGAIPNEAGPILGSRIEPRKGVAPYYNPLDPRVQTAMRRVTGELLARCASHSSFAGISMQLIPQGYAQLPDENWGLDDITFDRFVRDAKASPIPMDDNRFAARYLLIRGKMRESWLGWCAARLAEFYEQLQRDVVGANPAARLYLDTHELMAGRVVQPALRPQLPERDEFRDALLRHGLDTNLLQRAGGLVVLRPQRIAPVLSMPAQSGNLELEHSSPINKYFQGEGTTGSLAFHEPQPHRVPGFDQVSPFGADHTYTRLLGEFSPGGVQSRAHLVRSLVGLDASLLVNGGWMIPLGQEDVLRPILHTIRQLPADKFNDVPTAGPASDMVVRMLNVNGRTYVYLANATGMRGQVNLRVANFAPMATIQMLIDREPAPLKFVAENSWVAFLEPYDVVGFVTDSPNFAISQWSVEFEREDIAQLDRVVQDLRTRVKELRTHQPLRVLENPGFESPPANGQIRGWTATREVSVRIDNQNARSGQSSLCLRMENSPPPGNGASGPAPPPSYGRLRSNAFPIPPTGRLSFLMRLRTNDANRQPPVRMAMQGTLVDATPFYRFSQVLGGGGDNRHATEATRPLPTEWTKGAEGEFLFHFVNLPAGVGGQVSIGLDILGPGEVWVDDVEVFDMYFQEDECNELVRKTYLASLKLQQGEFAECRHILQTYWPRFVLEFGEAPRLTRIPVDAPNGLSKRDVLTTTPPPSMEMGAKDRSKDKDKDKDKEKPSRWPRLQKLLPFY